MLWPPLLSSPSPGTSSCYSPSLKGRQPRPRAQEGPICRGGWHNFRSATRFVSASQSACSLPVVGRRRSAAHRLAEAPPPETAGPRRRRPRCRRVRREAPAAPGAAGRGCRDVSDEVRGSARSHPPAPARRGQARAEQPRWEREPAAGPGRHRAAAPRAAPLCARGARARPCGPS